MKLITKKFSESLLNWYDQAGRQDLPWQAPYSAYRVWLSEIMLQQTQVKTVIPYFLRFITRFPDVSDLAAATLDEVLALWSGLGYYSRARNLHRCAQIIVESFQGQFPQSLKELQSLPGIGRSTAAAIAALAFEQPTAILDGNVKRVLSRYFMIAGNDRAYEKRLWELAETCMPDTACRFYTQAIMDMGALCCTAKQPKCEQCPLQTNCQAFQSNTVQNYPSAKPKKVIPTRQESFLLFHREGTIYLEQRPLQGIWGGLWCLPSLPSNGDPYIYIQEQYGISGQLHPFMYYKHTFTHFHLHITALHLFVKSPTSLSGTWFKPDALRNLGMAKPVNDIVQYFLTEKHCY